MKIAIFMRITGLILVNIFIFSLVVEAQFPTPDKKIIKYFNKKNVKVIIHNKTFMNKAVRYIEVPCTDSTNKALILFVHGTPSEGFVFKKYLSDSSLYNNATLISIDRIGYSPGTIGKAEPDIDIQARYIAFVLQHYKYNKLLVVAHSYGTPIAAKYIINYRNRAIDTKLILVSAPIDPDKESSHWYNAPVKWKLLKKLAPKKIRCAVVEQDAHKYQLEKMKNDWQKLDVETWFVHGKLDFVAPFSNVYFALKHVPAQYRYVLVLPHGTHLIMRYYRKYMKSLILDVLLSK